MRIAWLICSVAAVLAAPPAQVQGACTSAAHAALDFWVGDWDVTTPAGEAAGVSHVERILSGCVVMESWSSVRGSYMGKSFNTYDPATGTWTQHWVDTAGASILMTGAFDGDRLVYSRDLITRHGTPGRARMTFFNQEGTVRQLVEQSTDGGRTWTTQIDLTYRRRR